MKADHRVGGTLRNAVSALAALLAVTLTVTWAYRLGVRDAQDVPVIRAMVDEMRITPDSPGGLQVAHQDRQVYGLVTETEQETAAIETLAPPSEPLADEDITLGELALAADAAVDESTEHVTSGEAAEPAPVTRAEAPSDEVQSVTRMIPGPSIDDLVREALGAPATRIDGLSSPRPRVRPTLASAGERVSTVRAAMTRPAIQLGAYQTREVALEMWRSLAARNGDLLAGRDPLVDELVGSSRTLFGLRAVPFATIAEARGLCAALRARDEDCLVTQVR